MDEALITREGYEQLKAEIERLEGEERLRVAEEIAKARAYGDLSENYEYQAAKEEQGQLEARIAQLKARLKSAKIVDPADADGKVGLGHRVALQDVDSQRELEYRLVGHGEADASQGRISIQSPVGKSLYGRRVGDVVTVEVPAGKKQFKILEVNN